MMQMLNLPEGDSTQVQSSVPDAAATPEPAANVEVKAVEAKPVILAKDGVHTIEYEKLVEARDAERHWKQVALDAQAQLEAQKATPVAQVPAPAETPAADEDVFGDFSEEAIAKGVEKMVSARTAAIEAKFEAKLNAVLAPLQEKQAQSAEDAHFSTIQAAHPDVESIAQSAELTAWIDKQPSFVREGYKAVIAQGTAEQVIEALNTFKAATGKQAPTPARVSVEAAAQAAIAKAKSAPPMSLSEIPAGSNVAVDEANAMMEMTDAGMMNKFEGKTPEQINALLNRVL